MDWDTYYRICTNAQIYKSQRRPLRKFFFEVIIVAVIFTALLVLGNGGTFFNSISTLLPLIPLLLKQFNGLNTGDIWMDTRLLHHLTKTRVLAAKQHEENDQNRTFVLLRKDIVLTADQRSKMDREKNREKILLCLMKQAIL